MEQIKAAFIIEALGRPAEHLTTALNEMLDKLKTQKDVKVLSEKIAEPKKIEKFAKQFSNENI